MDSTEWEKIHSVVIARLQHSIYNDFPLPKFPLTPPATPSPEITSSPPKRRRLDLPSPVTPVLSSQKENEPTSSPVPAPPLQPQISSLNTTPASAAQSTSSEHGNPMSLSNSSDNDYKLPPELQENWDCVKDTLIESFSTHPPHTIQRFAELILEPRRHHKYLPAYLNALERVVSVTSSTKVFPLPPVEPSAGSGMLVNGDTTSSTTDKWQTDDSMGGALLTPIPWLQNGARNARGSQDDLVSTDSPQDPDVVMTTDEALLETGPLTQGELIRKVQELSDPPPPIASGPSQGVPAASQLSHASSAREVAEDEKIVNAESPEPEAEVPHARGPSQIGVEDTGPQEQGDLSPIGLMDLDAAVGRGSRKVKESHEIERTTTQPALVPDSTDEISHDWLKPLDAGHDPNSSRQTEMVPSTSMEKQQLEQRSAMAADVSVPDVDGMTDDEIQQAPALTGHEEAGGSDATVSEPVNKSDGIA